MKQSHVIELEFIHHSNTVERVVKLNGKELYREVMSHCMYVADKSAVREFEKWVSAKELDAFVHRNTSIRWRVRNGIITMISAVRDCWNKVPKVVLVKR